MQNAIYERENCGKLNEKRDVEVIVLEARAKWKWFHRSHDIVPLFHLKHNAFGCIWNRRNVQDWVDWYREISCRIKATSKQFKQMTEN